MKQVIQGKLYDTEKAKPVAEATEYERFSETLYRKRTGEFFLAGSGSADSKYAKSLGDNRWSGGSRIIPLTYDAAREWGERNMGVDEYEVVFGIPAEDDGTTALNINIDSAALAGAKQAAASAGITLTAWVTDAIKRAL